MNDTPTTPPAAGDEQRDTVDVTIVYLTGERDHYPAVGAAEARQLHDAAWLPGVSHVRSTRTTGQNQS